MSIRKFKEILSELLKRNLFNKDLYISSNILTNYNSESGKELVISKKQVKKNYIANKRKDSIVEFYNGNVVNKDIDIDIDTDKDIDKVIDRDIEKDKSNEETVIDEALELEKLKEKRKLRKKQY